MRSQMKAFFAGPSIVGMGDIEMMVCIELSDFERKACCLGGLGSLHLPRHVK